MDNSNYIYEMKAPVNKAKDSASIIKKENGYTLGVNSSNTIYLAFPGETEVNPHMYLGKDTPENRKKAEEVFNSFKSIKHTKDDRTADAGYVTTGRMVVRYAEDILREMGKNNSTGRYDRVVQGCRSTLGQSLLEGDKLKDAVRKEVERLLKKYNPNDARTVDKKFKLNIYGGKVKTIEANSEEEAREKYHSSTKYPGTIIKVEEVRDSAIDKAIRATDEIVTVNESDFVNSHAKNPKGYGYWIFGIGSKDMSDWFTVTGNYSESKKRAIEEAKKRGKSTIFTMG